MLYLNNPDFDRKKTHSKTLQSILTSVLPSWGPAVGERRRSPCHNPPSVRAEDTGPQASAGALLLWLILRRGVGVADTGFLQRPPWGFFRRTLGTPRHARVLSWKSRSVSPPSPPTLSPPLCASTFGLSWVSAQWLNPGSLSKHTPEPRKKPRFSKWKCGPLYHPTSSLSCHSASQIGRRAA